MGGRSRADGAASSHAATRAGLASSTALTAVTAGLEAGIGAAAAAAAMVSLAAAGLLIVSDVRLAGPDVLLTVAAAAAAAALGGHLYGSVTSGGDANGFASTPRGSEHVGDLSVGLLPLGVTMLGLGLLAAFTVRAYRRQGLRTVRTQLPRALAAVGAFTAAAALLAVGSQHDYAAQGSAFRLAVGVPRTAVGALVLAAGTLGGTLLLLHRRELAATRWLVGVLVDPLRGAAWALAVTSAATAVVALVAAAYSGPSAGFTAATVVLGLPNLVGYLLLLAVGTPISGGGSHIGFVALVDPPATDAVRDHGAVTLGSLARDQPLWWVVPIALAIVLVAGAVVAALDAGSPWRDRIRTLALYAGIWPAVLTGAALVLRVATQVTVIGEPTRASTLTTMLRPAFGPAILGGVAAGAGSALLGGVVTRGLQTRRRNTQARLAEPAAG